MSIPYSAITEEVDCCFCHSQDKRILQVAEPYKVVKCNECGLVYVSPRPAKATHRSSHGESNFKEYYHQTIDDFYQNKAALFQQENIVKNKRLDIVETLHSHRGKLLDIGTGQGLFLILAEKRGWEVFGTDISEHVCTYLSKKGLRVFCGYLEEAGFPDNYFDIVTMWHTLKHTLNPAETMREVYRILAPGGGLVIAVPRVTSVEIWLRGLIGKPLFRPGLNEWHLYHFSPKSIAFLIRKSGFYLKHIDAEPIYGRWERRYWLQFVRRVLSMILRFNLNSTILVYAIKPDIE